MIHNEEYRQIARELEGVMKRVRLGASIGELTNMEVIYGSYWAKVLDHELFIGYVWTEDELMRVIYRAAANSEVAEQTWQSMQDAYANGHRYGKCWSLGIPAGEIGPTHVDGLVPCAERTFQVLASMIGVTTDNRFTVGL